MHSWPYWGNKLLDALFPPQCMRCAALLSTHGTLCNACWQELHFITPPMCVRCGHPFEYDLGEGALCAACIQELPVYDSAYSALVYDDTSKLLAHKLKFEDQIHLAPIFAEWLANHWQSKPLPDVIIPVPLSRKRLWLRRYNQSALLAQQLAEILSVPYQPDWLLRIKHTKPQTGLTRAQRQENIRGAFTIASAHKASLQGKKVVLVDDVMTTGSTIDACSRTLKKAGASEVHVLTLARVVHGQ